MSVSAVILLLQGESHGWWTHVVVGISYIILIQRVCIFDYLKSKRAGPSSQPGRAPDYDEGPALRNLFRVLLAERMLKASVCRILRDRFSGAA
jgi:hypothetical protein